MSYTAQQLLVKPAADATDPGLILKVTPESAGWEYITFIARHMAAGERYTFDSGGNEVAIVNLTGRYSVRTNRGEWGGIGGRRSVFEGAAHALYLPRGTRGEVEAEEAGDFAVTWVPTDEDHDPWLIEPHTVPVSVRGGDNVSRQINDLLPPGSR
jgi:5-deoxy-glucuronate isomerase